MKYIIANWKGKQPDGLEQFLRTFKAHPDVKVILCPGHNGELGFEVGQ